MRTMARALITRRYVEQGNTTRIVVLPLAESGLPQSLVETGHPVPIDLLAGRPVNLDMDEEGLSADLCFAGPPVRCNFPWEAILAVQSPQGDIVQTLVVTIAMVMEDESVRPGTMDRLSNFEGKPEMISSPIAHATPSMVLLDGTGDSPNNNSKEKRPQLKIINGDKTST